MLAIGTPVQGTTSWKERVQKVLKIDTNVSNWYSSTRDDKLEGACTESVVTSLSSIHSHSPGWGQRTSGLSASRAGDSGVVPPL